ncbi:hypothetical protein [uncultured Lamprocystis sp.]|jgi:hypothetical protein|uniref:hypothetical protein n=1 Tax=uncultured Lamprocystis sp. TaxID=543132 RepID=UPI0025D6117B|nr:hypothetical protein [uncultured Lamprocystis sp.]
MYYSTGKHSIRKVDNLGEYITLDDGSRWQISFMDKTKSMMWMIIDDVSVFSYIGNKFKITHIKRNETVEATYLPG